MNVADHGLFADGVDVVDVDAQFDGDRHCTCTSRVQYNMTNLVTLRLPYGIMGMSRCLSSVCLCVTYIVAPYSEC